MWYTFVIYNSSPFLMFLVAKMTCCGIPLSLTIPHPSLCSLLQRWHNVVVYICHLQFLTFLYVPCCKDDMMYTVLEMAGRIDTKCDQTLVWATKFFPKDRPENEFGRPNLGRGYRMFSAYLRSITEINIFKTDQRTWGNNIVFLPKEAAIILTGSLRFSATCCLILFSKKTFSRTRLTL